MRIVFLVTACISILAVILICIFMFANGIPTIAEIGPANFLLGTKWKPLNGIFGILPMIVGSLYVTAGAILIGVPGRDSLRRVSCPFLFKEAVPGAQAPD